MKSARAAALRAHAQLLRADEAVLRHVHGFRAPVFAPVMRLFTRLGNTEGWLGMGIVLLAAGGSALPMAARLLVAAGLGAGLAQPIKRLSNRRRPHLGIQGFVALAEIPDAFSFPSGHTATAVSVAVAMSGEGSFLGPAIGLLAAGIATSRVYLGAHYPLDVLAGAAIGVCAGLMARAMFGT